MKSFNIVVKQPSQLDKYGFKKICDDCYDLRAPKNISLWLRADRNKLMIISASTPSIKVICEMYKDDVIAFENYEGAKHPYMLTPEEAEIIRQHRKEKEYGSN